MSEIDDLARGLRNIARGQWCVECFTIKGRFAYWLHRRGDKHRPL